MISLLYNYKISSSQKIDGVGLITEMNIHANTVL
jgi:hypothetical protein